jgi:hypothetical protein
VDELLSNRSEFLPYFSGETREKLREFGFEKKLNWNECGMPIQVESADFYISDAMDTLCGYSLFSLSDVVRINFLRGKMKTEQDDVVEM